LKKLVKKRGRRPGAGVVHPFERGKIKISKTERGRETSSMERSLRKSKPGEIRSGRG